MKRGIGLIIGFSLFFILLFLPPTQGMRIEALKVVLSHGTDELNRVMGIKKINSQNFIQFEEKARKIRVSIPSDFSKAGEKSIGISKKGPSLYDVVVRQAYALKNTIALAILMAVLWISEALPIPVVALFPMVFLPLLGIAHYKNASFPGYFIVFSPYMHYLVVLFIGGFTIAEAMKKWNLHKRIALNILKIIGFSPARIILGLMIATAVLSMFVSNTATTAMMMPIALAIILSTGKSGGFAKASLLGIAYAASVGGIGTIIGTPPNLVFAGFADTLLSVKMTFAKWLMIGMPLTIVMLPLIWYLLLKFFRVKKTKILSSKRVIEEKLKELGKMGPGERNTLIIFITVSFLWITRTWWTRMFHLPWVNDSVVAIIGVLLFYLFPVNLKKWEFTLTWDVNKNIPWGTLLLFGGGLALGTALSKTGAASYIASQIKGIGKLGLPLLLFLSILLVDFLTEITSNTATANMMMPVLFAVGVATGFNPLLLMMGGAVASSMAFMLPVATPPNAIVYGTGYIKIKDMVRFGVILDIIAAVVWTIILCAFTRFII